MKDAGKLTAAERADGYHNPRDGGYRQPSLTDALGRLV